MDHRTTKRSGWLRAVSALPLIGLVVGCEWHRPQMNPAGYETDDAACSDGVDNDQDGLVDCEDPDCIWESGQCGEVMPNVPPEQARETTVAYCNSIADPVKRETCRRWEAKAAVEQCHDGIDNDGNGKFDCGDDACKAMMEACCVMESDDARCSNGIDDDQNGFADCLDFSCRRGRYTTVCSGTAPSGPPETDATTCRDGKDNDGNGKTDCAELTCAALDVCKGDGSAEDTLVKCKDGKDNDGNGFVDCGDFSCSKNPDQAVVDYCASIAENTLAK